MQITNMAPAQTPHLTAAVEELLDSTEPEGTFRDTRECGAGFLLAALLIGSPPTPRPKKQTKNG
jgi:hypothetical protein